MFILAQACCQVSFKAIDFAKGILKHQQNSIRLARLAPDMPDATRLPYSVWRHIDARDAITFSCPRIWF